MNATVVEQARRNPEATRRVLLDAAFDEIYSSGFQAAGLDAILARSDVTKGALYHHFGNKRGLGYAVIEERVEPLVRDRYIEPFRRNDDPIDALNQMGLRMETEVLKVGILEKGCPLNNLIHEMSGVDEGFRKRLAEILEEWTATISQGLRTGQKNGIVRPDVDPDAIAAFVVSSFLGAVGIAKNAQEIEPFTACRLRVADYVETLRTTH